MSGMSRDGFTTDGLTTIECLVALVVFTVGVLGAAAATALALRVEGGGARVAAAARLAGSVLDSLRGELLAQGNRCSAIGAGSAAGSHGIVARWTVAASDGGREVGLVLSFPFPGRVAAETVWTFLPCR